MEVIKKNAGFTLIELMVTVGIIGILGAVSVPAVDKYRQKATRSAARVEAQALMKAFRSCLATEADIEACSTSTIGGMLREILDRDIDETTNFKGAKCLKQDDGLKLQTGFTDKKGKVGDRCYYNKDDDNNQTCFFSIKVTGGYVASYCVEYNPADGTVKEIGSSKKGHRFGDEITVCEKGKCQDIN